MYGREKTMRTDVRVHREASVRTSYLYVAAMRHLYIKSIDLFQRFQHEGEFLVAILNTVF